MTAKDLHAAVGAGKSVIGVVGLDDRRHQLNEVIRRLAGLLVGMPIGLVDGHTDLNSQRSTGLIDRLQAQEMTANVGMHDDRVGGLVRCFYPGQRPALQPVFRIEHRVLIGGFRQAQALQANPQTGIVHHSKHGFHAAVRLADQAAFGRFKVHHTGGRRLDPHLVLDRTAGHAVARARAAILAQQELRHQEQRYSLRARRGIGQLGEHQMNDVVGQVVLAAGDENFRPGDPIAAVLLRQGLGANEPQIRAALGFGQAHGAGPTAGHHLFEIAILERLAAPVFDRLVGAEGKTGIGAKGEIG